MSTFQFRATPNTWLAVDGPSEMDMVYREETGPTNGPESNHVNALLFCKGLAERSPMTTPTWTTMDPQIVFDKPCCLSAAHSPP